MSLTILGQHVDLSHLSRIYRRMTLDLKCGSQKKNALLEFEFSTHCYSRGPKDGEIIPDKMRVKDGSSQKPRDRIFCPDRYRHSKSLVARIDTLIAQNGLVQRSRFENFFSLDVVHTNASGTSTVIPYYIFMSAKKVQQPDQERKLAIFIESAYHEDPLIPAPIGEGRALPFSVMLGNRWAP